MAWKAEIGWTRTDDEGERWELSARHVSKRWEFFIRQRRFEQWQPLPEPPLEDWLALLDALNRLMVRRRYQPDDIERVRRAIRERFPEAKLD
jgi:hypothetical protein